MKLERDSFSDYQNQCRNLLARLPTGQQLTQGDLDLAIQIRVSDFRGANLSNLDLTYKDFDGANLIGADLTNANVRRVDFTGAILSQARMSSIRVERKKIPLLENELVLPALHPWATNASPIYHGTCSDCEQWNRVILGVLSRQDRKDFHEDVLEKYRRRGILITHGKELLGHFKLKGERTFLAARTVKDTSGKVVFWKGMVYGFDPILEQWLLDAGESYIDRQNTWRRADIGKIAEVLGNAKFGSNNYRFVTDPVLFKELDELCARVATGEEPFVDILTGENNVGVPRSVPARPSLKEIIQRVIRSLGADEPAKV